MGLISGLIKLGLIAGASVTAYQASEKSKQDEGKLTTDAFVKNFKELAVANSKLVVDTVKSKVGGKSEDGYRVSDEGENGYSYPDSEASAEDKVTEIFEDMKEKAPEVIGKVQDIVEDLREHAPEYKEKAQNIGETVKDAAKKVIDENKKDEETLAYEKNVRQYCLTFFVAILRASILQRGDVFLRTDRLHKGGVRPGLGIVVSDPRLTLQPCDHLQNENAPIDPHRDSKGHRPALVGQQELIALSCPAESVLHIACHQ